jgi:hypothetical protein
MTAPKRKVPWDEEQLDRLVNALALFIAQEKVPVRDVCRELTVKALEASLKRCETKREAAQNIGMKEQAIPYWLGPKAFPYG